MNALNGERNIEWVPDSGFQLRKAGVQFDAVRVDGEIGRRLADLMEELVGGEPGPVVTEANGRRGVYFFVPPGSTAHRCWPREVTILNSTRNRVSYVPVPALGGGTWPLSWRYPPTAPGRFVHTLILINAAESLLYYGRDR
ncbi:hypothetical protein ACFY9Q_14690 [Streptomyces sp. NPDC012389]|uniref:hypothetical protein n=1 Tax=unclassified Streptomyces TaxID=2593676 RepID=UPI00081D926F|nr:hypothetical protein [Streptomyces sp. ScaeMP-e83]MYR94907.1 hypothetical protein [Streptomyces sp. SID4937]MYX15292.1 hypothetical protein [Streptomyces sp. SID8374]SCD80112.1 hypothetical protein GA0115243_1043115 [Streptomyces sp. ScaeMP-e83]